MRNHHGDQPPKGFVGEPPPGFDVADVFLASRVFAPFGRGAVKSGANLCF